MRIIRYITDLIIALKYMFLRSPTEFQYFCHWSLLFFIGCGFMLLAYYMRKAWLKVSFAIRLPNAWFLIYWQIWINFYVYIYRPPYWEVMDIRGVAYDFYSTHYFDIIIIFSFFMFLPLFVARRYKIEKYKG